MALKAPPASSKNATGGKLPRTMTQDEAPAMGQKKPMPKKGSVAPGMKNPNG